MAYWSPGQISTSAISILNRVFLDKGIAYTESQAICMGKSSSTCNIKFLHDMLILSAVQIVENRRDSRLVAVRKQEKVGNEVFLYKAAGKAAEILRNVFNNRGKILNIIKHWQRRKIFSNSSSKRWCIVPSTDILGQLWLFNSHGNDVHQRRMRH